MGTNIFKIARPLIRSIVNDPFFMEMKLIAIEFYLHLMDYDTVATLVEAFKELLELTKSRPRRNFLTCNTNFLMLSLTIALICQKIKR